MGVLGILYAAQLIYSYVTNPTASEDFVTENALHSIAQDDEVLPMQAVSQIELNDRSGIKKTANRGSKFTFC